jgi:hypothetical protein
MRKDDDDDIPHLGMESPELRRKLASPGDEIRIGDFHDSPIRLKATDAQTIGRFPVMLENFRS